MVYIDGSFVKHKIPVKPMYVTVCNLSLVVSGKACLCVAGSGHAAKPEEERNTGSDKERAAETSRRRKPWKVWFKVKEVFDSTCSEYILVYTQYIQLHTGPKTEYTHFSLVTVWTAIYQIPTPAYHANHAMCMGCAYMQIQASETSPKVWKKAIEHIAGG